MGWGRTYAEDILRTHIKKKTRRRGIGAPPLPPPLCDHAPEIASLFPITEPKCVCAMRYFLIFFEGITRLMCWDRMGGRGGINGAGHWARFSRSLYRLHCALPRAHGLPSRVCVGGCF